MSHLFPSSGMALLSFLLFFRHVPFFFGEWGEGTWDELLSRVTFIFGCELEGGSPLSSCVLMGTATKLFLFPPTLPLYVFSSFLLSLCLVLSFPVYGTVSRDSRVIHA